MNPGTSAPSPQPTGAPVPLVTFTRGQIAESTHYGSIAVVDAWGRLVARAGNPGRVTTMRSSAKPFQAMAVVETGAADAFALTPAELALVAASHSGEPRHCQGVAELLRRAGLTPADLQAGLHPPLDPASRAALERSGEPPSPLQHNCSGKHAGMLCACVHAGWDTRTYVRPDHPLQRRILHLLGDLTGLPLADVGIAIDGCGVPTFAAPLTAMALAFARLVDTSGDGHSHQPAAARVVSAMLAHPEMVAGSGRFDTDLMHAAGGRVLAKAGAEACHGAALLDRGWGIALKIEDGGARAVGVAVAETLRQLGALTDADGQALERHARPILHNYRGEIVGEGRPVFTLERA